MADASDPPRPAGPPPDGACEAPTAPVLPPLPGGLIPDGWLLAALLAAGDAATIEGDAPTDDAPTLRTPTPGEAAAPAPGAGAPTPLAREYVRLLRRPGAAGADAPLALGRFEVIGLLGQGGFGTVYLARDPRLKRLVALKVPHPQMVLSPGSRERFLREGRAAARLQHDAIVQVLDVEEPNPIGTIAYAYWPGPTLAQWLRSQAEPVPARRAAVLVATLADAVAHAHAMGVLHRDIKPANVILTATPSTQDRGEAPPDGAATAAAAGAGAEADPLPKLTDFGLARVTGEGPDDMKTGAPFGTPPYMAPEQAAGLVRQVGPWTDVYALGAVLYEILAGRPPFQGDSPTETMLQVLQDDPVTPRALRRRLPRDLETIVLTCLQKLPARRYPSAEALRDDLRRFLDGRPIAARPEWLAAKGLRWLRRRPALFAALVVAALAPLVLLGGMLAWNAALRDLNTALRQEQERSDASAQRALRHLYGAELREAADALAAGQPERAQELLALLAAKPGWERSREFTWRYVRDAARRPLVVLSGPEERITAIAASADGRRLATGDRDGTVRVRDAAGALLGQVQAMPGPVRVVALSPDGTRGAALGPDALGVVLLDPDAGGILARFPAGPGEVPLALQFGDDAETLWLLIARPGEADPTLVRLLVAREGPRGAMTLRAAGQWPAAGALAVAADGRRVARRDAAPGSLVVAEAASDTVLFRAPVAAPAAVAHAAISADGRRVAAVVARPDGQDLVVWDVATGAERGRHPAPAEPFLAVALSADGALVLGRQHNGRTLVRGDGVSWDVEPLIGDPDRPAGGVSLLDPLGRTVAISQQTIRGGPQPLRVYDAATGTVRGEFPGSLQRTIEAAYAGDGRTLAVRSGHRALAWPLDPTPDPQPAGHAREAWAAAFTPDGGLLVSGSDDVGEPLTVRVWEAATGTPLAAWKAHPGTTAALAVHPSLPLLATVGLADRENLRLWEIPSGEPVADLPGNAGWLRAAAFSPDGKWLAVAGNERVVRLYDVAARRPVRTLEGATSVLRAVAFSPDGRWLAAGGNDDAVRAWDLADLDAPPRVVRGDLHIAALAYTPDSATLVVGEEEGGLLLRDARTLALARRLDSGCEELRCLAIAPDGRTLAAPGAPGRLALWDLQTGQRLATVAVGPAKLQGLRFAPDGTALALCDYDGRVRLLRAPAPR
jgi:WD40 repeat protein